MISTEEYLNYINNWKKKNVLQLASHFHKFCAETNQFKRVHHFEMLPNFVDEFTQLGNRIASINICLAITNDESEQLFSIYPILEIRQNGSIDPVYLPLEAKEKPADGFTSEFVPEIFKDMILDNWNKLDTALIDDLFIARAKDSNNLSIDQMVRVHHFEIDPNMIKFINDLNAAPSENGHDSVIPNILGIKLYPGVDMNKFGSKKFISFTPVLSLLHSENPPQFLSRHGLIEAGVNETFIEYSLPCPPTCRK